MSNTEKLYALIAIWRDIHGRSQCSTPQKDAEAAAAVFKTLETAAT